MEKAFNVDWDSLDEVTRLFNRAKARYCELKRLALGRPSRKEQKRRVFDACQTILNSNIAALYAASPLSEERKFFVYAHLDTSRAIAVGASGITTFAATLGMKFFPFYIGKGTYDRAFLLGRNETHRKVRERLSRLGKEPEVFVLPKMLTESEALQLESKLIDIFGLITNGGYLTNLDEGLLPDERRTTYASAYKMLRQINTPLLDGVTHVNGA